MARRQREEEEPAAARSPVRKDARRGSRCNNRRVLAQAVEAMLGSELLCRVPRSIVSNTFSIGSACSGLCAELLACLQLGASFIPIFCCDLDRSARHLSELTYGHAYHYENVEHEDFQQSPYVDVFVAGWPCQPYSQMGANEGFFDRHGRGLVINFVVKWIRSHRPKLFLLENVSNLTTKRAETFLAILEMLPAIGAYRITWKVLNARLHSGLPQNRSRVFVCGIRQDVAESAMSWPGEALKFPKETDYVW